MRRPRSFELVSFVYVCLLVNAARLHAQIPDTWPSVPKDDLALKDNPANPGCSAMILERQVYTDDEKRFQTEWIRIKVLTEAGRDNADVEIPYSAKGTSIEGIRGRTVQPDGTEVIFNGVVFDKIIAKHKKIRYDVKAFTLPAVAVGSVIEYAYTVRWKQPLPDYVRSPGQYTFQTGWTIPTATWAIQQDLFTRHAVFVIRPVKGGHLDFAKVRLDSPVLMQTDGTMRLEISNVAAIEKETHMPPDSMLNSRVHFYYRVGFLGNYWYTYSSDQTERVRKFMATSQFLQREVNDLAPPGDPPETKLRKLYSRVQQIRYLSYEPSKTDKEEKREHLAENKSVEDILRHGYAYGNEINFLFTALARAAGFDAWIVEVVDRATGLFEPQVLDGSQLNAIIVLVRLNGKDFYFDPASRFCPYGLVPWFESDTKGVRWVQGGAEPAEIPALSNQSSAIERTAELTLKPEGDLEGTLEIVFTGQEALDRRLETADEDDAGRREFIEDEIKDMAPSRTTIDLDSVTGWQDSDQPLRIKCHFYTSHFAVLTRERMLFRSDVFQSNRKTPFVQSRRIQPVYLRHGYSELDKITIVLPTGHRVEAMPADIDYKTAFATFEVKRTAEVGVVHLERQAVMNGYYFPVDSYGSLRAYFEMLRETDAQNVVLHELESTQTH